MWTSTCTTLSAAFSDDGTSWPDLGTASFPSKMFSENWASFLCSVSPGLVCECLDMRPVREPDDRNGQVRFDERGGETERWITRRE